jgi:hypothetical protein
MGKKNKVPETKPDNKPCLSKQKGNQQSAPLASCVVDDEGGSGPFI